jgi:phosphoenolpyruvate-protein phosphotransferase (PTS system enzyme I)
MDKKNSKVRMEFKGHSLSQGVAEGKAFLLKPINLEALSSNRFEVEDTEGEIGRLKEAVEKSLQQLAHIMEHAEENGNKEAHSIFNAQMAFLNDHSFLGGIRSRVQKEKVNMEHVLAQEISSLSESFARIVDETIKVRFSDIEDVYHRLLRNLLDIEHVRANPVRKLSEPVIFIADKLLPSDMALLDFGKILGVAVAEGSAVSHVSIICRSLEIPALSGVTGASDLIRTGDPVLLDGIEGRLIVHPSHEDKALFKGHPKTTRFFPSIKPGAAKVPLCRTRDGREISLEANAGSLKEVERAARLGASGIGLLRTELFYMSMGRLPGEEEEVRFYKDVLREMKGRPVTLRLLDLGADKGLPYIESRQEENPQLGSRGIRFLFRHPELLDNHLKRILLASREGPMRLLIPFVSGAEEVDSFRDRLENISLRESLPLKNVKTGIMVEIPSAAFTLSDFIDKIDFVSIGTNDLIQYFFAVSREDPDLEEYREPLHPGILRLLRSVAAAAEAAGKPVSLCGEMAGDPQAALLLTGLGLSGLSMAPEFLPPVRDTLNAALFSECKALAEAAVKMKTGAEVKRLLQEKA